MSGSTSTATTLKVLAGFSSPYGTYKRGDTITDPAKVNAILADPAYSANVYRVGGTTTGGGTSTGGGTTTGGGTVTGSLSGVPGTAVAGSSLSGVTYTLNGTSSGTVVVLSGGAVVSQATVASGSGNVPAMGLPSAAGSAAVQLKDAAGNVLYQTSINVTAASTGTGGGGTTATPSGSLGGVPSSATAGTSLSGITYSLNNTTSATVAVVSGSTVVSSTPVSGASGTVPALALPSTAGTVSVQLQSGGSVLWQTTVTVNAQSSGGAASATISGPSAAAVAGQAATFLIDLTNTTAAYLGLETTAGVASGTRVSVTGDGFWSITPGVSGTLVAAVYTAATGGTKLAQTPSFTVSAASTGGTGGTTTAGGSLSGVPANATAGTTLSGVTYTLTGTTSGSVAILSGGVVQSSVAVSGASGTVAAMTFPASAGQVQVQLRDGAGNPLWQTTVTLAAASGGTGTTGTPGATISGPSAAAITGQTMTFLVDLTGSVTSAYLGLLSGGVATGTRVAITGDGFASIAAPSAAGNYSAGVFSAATGGTKYAETPLFAVSAPASTGTGGTSTGGGTTTPTGKYLTGLAAATDGSGKMLAAWSDGTTSDLTTMVSDAVASLATPVAVTDFGPAVTSVVPDVLQCTGSVNFRSADHHGKTLQFASGGTLALGASADATPGTWCRVLNTSAGTAQVALGSGMVSAGGNTVAPGQTVTLIAATAPDGTTKLYANTSLSNPAVAQTLSFASAVGNQTAGQSFSVALNYTNGKPSGLEWAVSVTGPWNTATGATIADASGTPGTGTASFLHPGLASSATAYTLRVRDKVNTDVTAVSNAFTVSAASTGTTAPTTTTVTGSLYNVPTTGTAGGALTGATYSISGATSGYVVIVTTAGAEVGSRTALTAASGTVPGVSLPSTAGTYKLRLLGPDGLTLADSPNIAVAAASTGGTTTSYTGPLDSYTSTWLGLYSVARRLRSAYTGPAIRVRRSSDSTEQDIGFTGAGALDTTALTSFVGSGDGFIRYVYDQSGNARHAFQSGTNYQPKIVVGGAVQTLGGKPTIRFSNASYDQCLGVNNLPALPNATMLAMAVFNAATLPGDGFGRVFQFYSNSVVSDLLVCAGTELHTQRYSLDGSQSLSAKAYFIAAGQTYVADAEYTTGGFGVHVSPSAGVNYETAAFGEGWGGSGGQIGIGGALTGNLKEALNGSISEWAFSNAPAAGERANLAASMRSTYGVAA